MGSPGWRSHSRVGWIKTDGDFEEIHPDDYHGNAVYRDPEAYGIEHQLRSADHAETSAIEKGHLRVHHGDGYYTIHGHLNDESLSRAQRHFKTRQTTRVTWDYAPGKHVSVTPERFYSASKAEHLLGAGKSLAAKYHESSMSNKILQYLRGELSIEQTLSEKLEETYSTGTMSVAAANSPLSFDGLSTARAELLRMEWLEWKMRFEALMQDFRESESALYERVMDILAGIRQQSSSGIQQALYLMDELAKFIENHGHEGVEPEILGEVYGKLLRLRNDLQYMLEELDPNVQRPAELPVKKREQWGAEMGEPKDPEEEDQDIEDQDKKSRSRGKYESASTVVEKYLSEKGEKSDPPGNDENPLGEDEGEEEEDEITGPFSPADEKPFYVDISRQHKGKDCPLSESEALIEKLLLEEPDYAKHSASINVALSHGWKSHHASAWSTTMKHPGFPGHTLHVHDDGQWSHFSDKSTSPKIGKHHEDLNSHLAQHSASSQPSSHAASLSTAEKYGWEAHKSLGSGPDSATILKHKDFPGHKLSVYGGGGWVHDDESSTKPNKKVGWDQHDLNAHLDTHHASATPSHMQSGSKHLASFDLAAKHGWDLHTATDSEGTATLKHTDLPGHELKIHSGGNWSHSGDGSFSGGPHGSLEGKLKSLTPHSKSADASAVSTAFSHGWDLHDINKHGTAVLKHEKLPGHKLHIHSDGKWKHDSAEPGPTVSSGDSYGSLVGHLPKHTPFDQSHYDTNHAKFSSIEQARHFGWQSHGAGHLGLASDTHLFTHKDLLGHELHIHGGGNWTHHNTPAHGGTNSGDDHHTLTHTLSHLNKGAVYKSASETLRKHGWYEHSTNGFETSYYKHPGYRGHVISVSSETGLFNHVGFIGAEVGAGHHKELDSHLAGFHGKTPAKLYDDSPETNAKHLSKFGWKYSKSPKDEEEHEKWTTGSFSHEKYPGHKVHLRRDGSFSHGTESRWMGHARVVTPEHIMGNLKDHLSMFHMGDDPARESEEPKFHTVGKHHPWYDTLENPNPSHIGAQGVAHHLIDPSDPENKTRFLKHPRGRSPVESHFDDEARKHFSDKHPDELLKVSHFSMGAYGANGATVVRGPKTEENLRTVRKHLKPFTAQPLTWHDTVSKKSHSYPQEWVSGKTFEDMDTSLLPKHIQEAPAEPHKVFSKRVEHVSKLGEGEHPIRRQYLPHGVSDAQYEKLKSHYDRVAKLPDIDEPLHKRYAREDNERFEKEWKEDPYRSAGPLHVDAPIHPIDDHIPQHEGKLKSYMKYVQRWQQMPIAAHNSVGKMLAGTADEHDKSVAKDAFGNHIDDVIHDMWATTQHRLVKKGIHAQTLHRGIHGDQGEKAKEHGLFGKSHAHIGTRSLVSYATNEDVAKGFASGSSVFRVTMPRERMVSHHQTDPALDAANEAEVIGWHPEEHVRVPASHIDSHKDKSRIRTASLKHVAMGSLPSTGTLRNAKYYISKEAIHPSSHFHLIKKKPPAQSQFDLKKKKKESIEKTEKRVFASNIVRSLIAANESVTESTEVEAQFLEAGGLLRLAVERWCGVSSCAVQIGEAIYGNAPSLDVFLEWEHNGKPSDYYGFCRLRVEENGIVCTGTDGVEKRFTWMPETTDREVACFVQESCSECYDASTQRTWHKGGVVESLYRLIRLSRAKATIPDSVWTQILTGLRILVGESANVIPQNIGLRLSEDSSGDTLNFYYFWPDDQSKMAGSPTNGGGGVQDSPRLHDVPGHSDPNRSVDSDPNPPPPPLPSAADAGITKDKQPEFKESKDDEYGGWLLKSGKFQSVGRFGHSNHIVLHPELYGVELEGPFEPATSHYKKAFDQGHIRVVKSGHGTVSFHGPLSQSTLGLAQHFIKRRQGVQKVEWEHDRGDGNGGESSTLSAEKFMNASHPGHIRNVSILAGFREDYKGAWRAFIRTPYLIVDKNLGTVTLEKELVGEKETDEGVAEALVKLSFHENLETSRLIEGAVYVGDKVFDVIESAAGLILSERKPVLGRGFDSPGIGPDPMHAASQMRVAPRLSMQGSARPVQGKRSGVLPGVGKPDTQEPQLKDRPAIPGYRMAGADFAGGDKYQAHDREGRKLATYSKGSRIVKTYAFKGDTKRPSVLPHPSAYDKMNQGNLKKTADSPYSHAHSGSSSDSSQDYSSSGSSDGPPSTYVKMSRPRGEINPEGMGWGVQGKRGWATVGRGAYDDQEPAWIINGEHHKVPHNIEHFTYYKKHIDPQASMGKIFSGKSKLRLWSATNDDGERELNVEGEHSAENLHALKQHYHLPEFDTVRWEDWHTKHPSERTPFVHTSGRFLHLANHPHDTEVHGPVGKDVHTTVATMHGTFGKTMERARAALLKYVAV